MQDCLSRAKQILSFLTFPILLLEQLPSAVDSVVVSLLALTSNFRGKWTAALTSPKLTHRRLKYPQQVRDELFPQVEELKYLWVLFTSKERMEED